MSPTFSCPSSDQCHKATHSLKGTEALSRTTGVSTQQYQLCELFWLSAMYFWVVRVLLLLFAFMQRKCKTDTLQNQYSPIVYTTHIIFFSLVTLYLPCFQKHSELKKQSEFKSHTLDIFFILYERCT